MELDDLSKETLQAFLLYPEELQQKMAREAMEWNQSLEPSLNMVKYVLTTFLEANLPPGQQQKDQARRQYLLTMVKDIPQRIHLFTKQKFPKNFIRAFLAIIKANKLLLGSKLPSQVCAAKWKEIPVELLDSYFQAFDIVPQHEDTKPSENSIVISQAEIGEKLDELLHRKNYQDSFALVKITGKNEKNVEKLISRMSNNKMASKAADYVKKLGIDAEQFPLLQGRLCKSTVRYFLTKYGWEQAEEIFQDHPESIICIIEDLIYKQKYEEALSIWYRNKATLTPELLNSVKGDCKAFLADYISGKKEVSKQQLVCNILFEDQLPDPKMYLILQDFKLSRENMYWLGKQNLYEIVPMMLKVLNNANYIGIDTQSIVGQTKLQKVKNQAEEAATLQIATQQAIFILDGFHCKCQQLRACFQTFVQDGKMIIGHSLENDMSIFWNSLGFTGKQVQDLKNAKIIDIHRLFKSTHPKSKYSNLAFICKTLLGKEINKEQTLSNWKRRPLRENQLHYAAMDALVTIKCYNALVQQYGQPVVQYYCEMGSVI